MIYFVVAPQSNRFAIAEFVHAYIPALLSKIRFIEDCDLVARQQLPEARTWVFIALDQADASMRQQLIVVEQRLRDTGARILNAPSQIVLRYDLLRSLHATGINTFQVHPVDAHTWRYPIFIRSRLTHDGSQTALLRSVSDYRLALDENPKLVGADMMVVEFCETQNRYDRMYRKYSVLRVGDRYIPRHVLFSTCWVTKTPDIVGPGMAAEEADYLNPRTWTTPPEIIRAFELAGVQYGRVDYGLLGGRPQFELVPQRPGHVDYSMRGGRPQIWEINFNPTVVQRLGGIDSTRHKAQKQVAKQTGEAFEALLA